MQQKKRLISSVFRHLGVGGIIRAAAVGRLFGRVQPATFDGLRKSPKRAPRRGRKTSPGAAAAPR